jgi:hypothetical protein
LGTSVNQSSPKTLNWQAVHASYRNPETPVDRVVTEVWRAASNQPHGDLTRLLSTPIVARLGELAMSANTSAQVARSSAIEIVTTKAASLAADIARRAAVQCIGSADRAAAYRERVFAEATNYLVSRDLAGFVGSGRAKRASDSIQFKTAVIKHVNEVARSVRAPKTFSAKSWNAHVQKVVAALQGRKK